MIKEKWTTLAKNASLQNELSYQNWFESATSMKAVKSQAYLDFFHRIWTDKCYKELGNPLYLKALEIGSGGGRLINCASTIFDDVTGCDIVNTNDLTLRNTINYLFSQNADLSKIHLLTPEDLRFVEDKSINFIYSFISFQHMDKSSVLHYLSEIKRLSSSNNMSRIFCSRTEKCDFEETQISEFVLFDITFKCSPQWLAGQVEQLGGTILNIEERPKKQLWAEESVSGQFMIDFKF